jgi:hypothetical protein
LISTPNGAINTKSSGLKNGLENPGGNYNIYYLKTEFIIGNNTWRNLI